MSRRKFTGYVLAGGKSSRMKRDKAFLELRGKTFLQTAFDVLAPNCKKVFAVLNSNQTHFNEKLSANSEYIFDIHENRGALGGIHAALKNCQTEFAVISAVDMPFVTNDAVAKLCEIAEQSEDFSGIVPRQSDGRLQPLCAVYRVKDCLPKTEEILEKEKSASVRDFLQTVKTKIIEVKDLSKKENLFENINFPFEFENVKSKKH